MKHIRKILLLLCVGALYNLYFTLINSDYRTWGSLLLFLSFAYFEIVILELLFKRSLKFQKNVYVQIIAIFGISSGLEIGYMLAIGRSLLVSLYFVMIGLPLTIAGLLYWKYYLAKIDKLLKDKKSRISK